MNNHVMLMIMVAISTYAANAITRQKKALSRKLINCIVPALIIFIIYIIFSNGERKWHILFIGYLSVAFWVCLDALQWKGIKTFFKNKQNHKDHE